MGKSSVSNLVIHYNVIDMITFNLIPFSLPLTNVHTLKVSLNGTPYEISTSPTIKKYYQDVNYELWRTSDEGNLICAEKGQKTVPIEILSLITGQLTGTLTPEQKTIAQTFIKTFNENIVIKFN
jgi:hypothetical protein